MADILVKNEEKLMEALAHLSEGGVLQNFKKIDESLLVSIYSIGYQYYQSGRYPEAVQLFQFLCLYDHLNVRYFKAMAAAQFMLKNYQHAMELYSWCYYLESDNPEYPFQSGLCHLALGHLEEAESGFYAATLWGENEEDYLEIKKKAGAMLALVKRKKSLKKAA